MTTTNGNEKFIKVTPIISWAEIWQSCTDSRWLLWMLKWVPHTDSELRLFACWCAQQAWGLSGHVINEDMVEVAEHMLRHEFEALLCSLSAEHLSSGSMIYITTPIVDVTGPSASNAHHKCEYSIEDFRRIIEGANLRITASDFQIVKSTAGDMRQGFFVLEN